MTSIYLEAAQVVFLGTSFLVAAVFLLDRVFPENFVRERHDLALSIILLTPILFALALLPGPEGVVLSDAPRVAQAAQEPEPPLQNAARSFQGVKESDAVVSWAAILLALWGVGLCGQLLRLGLGLVRMRKMQARATPVCLPDGMHLSRGIAVRRTHEVAAPVLIGYFEPVILVPQDFRLASDDLPVLEHEIAHAVRGDNWLTLVLRLITAVFWWNLALRLLQPVLDVAREKLCDDRAAAVTGAPKVLARALLDHATRAQRRRAPSLAARSHGSAVGSRVRRLAAPGAGTERRPKVTLRVLMPVLSAAALVLTPGLGDAQPVEKVIPTTRTDPRSDRLYSAALRGDLNEVRRLISYGVAPSAAAPGDGTPLMAAVRGDHSDVLEELLSKGADPNVASPGDGTALIAAAQHGRTALLKRLLVAGADPNLGIERDGSPLISAAHGGHLEILNLLLGAGADPNRAYPRDGNPLIAASLAGRPGPVRRLLEAGADPNGYVYRDETPLINAAQQGHVEVADILVTAGAEVSLTVRTPHGDPGGPYRSPLSEARRRGHQDMVRWLESRGAKHQAPNADE